MKENREAGGIILPYFKLYYKAIVTKTVQHWQKNQGHTSMEWNSKPRNESTHICTINYDKVQRIYKGESIVSSLNSAGKTRCKRMQLGYILHHTQKLTQTGLKT